MVEKIEPQLPTDQLEAELPTPSFWQKQKANKFKILGGILGILVLAGAVFGAYKFGQKQVWLTSQPTPTPVVVATPTPDPTANWKTYTNTKYGYSIKYPNEWTVEAMAGAPVETFDEPVISGPPNADIQGQMFIEARVKAERNTPKEAFEKEKSLGGILETITEKASIFAGYDAYKTTLRYRQEGYENGVVTKAIYLIRDDYLYKIFYSEWHRTMDIKSTDDWTLGDTFNLMLSTFGFLEETEGWKVYSNTELKFGLKYPEVWHVYNIDPSSVFVTSLSHKPAPDEKYTGLLVHFRTDLTPENLAGSRRLIKWTVEELEIGGTDGFKAYPSSRAEIQSPEIDWYFPDRAGTGTFEIQAVYYIGDKESNLEIFDKILSTFRFLE